MDVLLSVNSDLSPISFQRHYYFTCKLISYTGEMVMHFERADIIASVHHTTKPRIPHPSSGEY